MTYSFLFANFLSSITIFTFGAIFSKIFLDSVEKPKLEEIGFYGFIFLSFIALIFHFFFPLNKIIGNLILVCSLIYFFLILVKSDKKKSILIHLITVSLISILLLYGSNINRPDAGLYHLPYTRYLQENKIILGLTNIHHRFGHISIVQYISALYNNIIFSQEYVTVPLSNIFGFFFVYIFKLALELKNFLTIKNLFFLILSIFSVYSFSRYSNYGNDATSHLFFILIIINLLFLKKLETIEIIKINLFSIFCFLNKTFMIIVLLIPIFFNIKFFLEKKKFDINKNTLFCIILVVAWLIKNVLVSGCLVYPISNSCFKKLSYVDINQTKLVEMEGSAWSKEIKNEQILKIPREIYIENFNWVNGWFQFHFKKIIEKISPLIIVLLLIFTVKLFLSKFRFNKTKFDRNILYITFFSSIFLVIWFLKFPLYRFGSSYIAVTIISITCIFLSKIDNKNNINFFKNFSYMLIFLSIFGIIYKNISRIVDSNRFVYINYPWPKIYTLNKNIKNLPSQNKKIFDSKGEFIYFYSDKECMFNNSPCSNYQKKSLNLKYFLSYKTILPN